MKSLAAFLLLFWLPLSAAEIEDLSWLSGCWTYNDSDAGSGENWMAPAGGWMLATSRTVKDGETIGFEYLRISETDDGSLALFASPSGREAVRFDLLALSENEVVFENPQHDFPQRVIYRLDSSDRLTGRIEGTSDGQDAAIDFPMTRADCESLHP